MLLVVEVLVVAAVVFAVAALAVGKLDRMPSAEPDGVGDSLPEGPLEASDVLAARFDLAPRGYRMAEVDAVLERLAGEIARRDAEIARLSAPAGRPATTSAMTSMPGPTAPAERPGIASLFGGGGAGGGQAASGGPRPRLGELFRASEARARSADAEVSADTGATPLTSTKPSTPSVPEATQPESPRPGDLFRPRRPAVPPAASTAPRPDAEGKLLPRRRLGLRDPDHGGDDDAGDGGAGGADGGGGAS